MAPYIANKIKQATSKVVDGQEQTNVLANTMAHAVAGAVLAQLAGNSATAGAAGAAGGELMARAILNSMYPGKQASDLTQDEKQVVSALGQLAAQLSGEWLLVLLRVGFRARLRVKMRLRITR
ncbi:hypothetical protein BEE12_18960 [Pantoea agglomerans]|uniref:VENN motif pre-toxin domain-containing protein n=1 Tax=Enterobacter agglomerans TaxID=549 RepID=UPI00083D5573|nr:VENN motif pre-toxin domain-containing protein [Pantoea agglomerans]AOE41760.1 hypothetical protein BEE12_18960 [Pantoea agglomerans]